MAAVKKVNITQVKSAIGRNQKQRNTLTGLGLGRIGKMREHNLTPQIQGMINKVGFLLKIEEVK
ncbi:MAG: 50S ribosomal protein L30 [Spirochaetia bacterium]|nr:50S ribosomal protein L30 [Spirochaetia bacterium]